MTDLEQTAYHEAGHAVVALALGVPVKRVTIDRTKVRSRAAKEAVRKHLPRVRGEVTLGISRLKSPGPLLAGRPWAIKETMNHIAVNLAGEYAILKAQDFDFDPDKLRTLAGIYPELKPSLPSRCLETVCLGAVARIEHQTHKILDKHWPAVKALAYALLERRTMSGREVRALLNVTVHTPHTILSEVAIKTRTNEEKGKKMNI